MHKYTATSSRAEGSITWASIEPITLRQTKHLGINHEVLHQHTASCLAFYCRVSLLS
jgi:hypothetical protein